MRVVNITILLLGQGSLLYFLLIAIGCGGARFEPGSVAVESVLCDINGDGELLYASFQSQAFNWDLEVAKLISQGSLPNHISETINTDLDGDLSISFADVSLAVSGVDADGDGLSTWIDVWLVSEDFSLALTSRRNGKTFQFNADCDGNGYVNSNDLQIINLQSAPL